MAVRQIFHPGVEIREIDRSNYAPAIVGTNVMCIGFSDKGEAEEPFLVTSKSEFTEYFGKPTNEAERYFYYGGAEVIDAGGTLIAAKIPYNNTISQKYKAVGLQLGSTEDVSGATSGAVNRLLSGNFNRYNNLSLTGDGGSDPILLTNNQYDMLSYGADWNEIDSAGTTNIASLDFLIVNENKARITGADKNEGIFIVCTDIIDAMKVQRMCDSTVYADSVLSGIAEQMNALTGIKALSGTEGNYNERIFTQAGEYFVQNLTGDLKDESFSEVLMKNFPTIELDYNLQDGTINKEYAHNISVMVCKTFEDDREQGKLHLTVLEAFNGSLHRFSRNPATGQSNFIGDIINAQSNFIKFYSKIPTEVQYLNHNYDVLSANGIYEIDRTNTTDYENTIALTIADNQLAPLIGFTDDECVKKIKYSDITTSIDTILDKVSNIDEIQLDVISDTGLSTIAQFTDDTADGTRFDPVEDVDSSDVQISSFSDIASWKTIVDKYIRFCKDVRKDCMCIVDVPRQTVVQGNAKYIRKTKPSNNFFNTINPKLKFLTGLNSSYAAIYMNWMNMVDDFSGIQFWCPQSVKMAGIYVNTDENANYWDAPAGLNRGQITGIFDLAINPNGKEADQIYLKSFNYAKRYPLDGFIAEGQKTSQVKPSAFDRVNVRRLFLRLERAVYQAARYFVYEPNNLFTRRRLIDTIDPIFRRVQTAGGIVDYQILCDATNNPPDVVENNELKVTILIKPTKTVEFIIVDFVATRQDATFSELIPEVI